MKLLFIDHEFHKKTHSADFFVNVLRKAFLVTEHGYSRFYRTGAKKAMKGHEVAVIWEFPISRNRFFFPGKRNVFVPMYDNELGSYWQWKRIAWSGMGVISFCDKITTHARRCGVTNLLDVRYFPNPASLPQKPGDSKKVFLWERGDISRQMAERLFPPTEGYSFVVKGANEFLPREQYLDLVASCGIVVAPRRREGIGMAFLEAMAMGKCVVAYNDATMNEYIENGKNGVLFDEANLTCVDSEKVAHVRTALVQSQAGRHSRWESDKEMIGAFIAAQPICRPSFVNGIKLALSYPLYLVEGAVAKLRQR